MSDMRREIREGMRNMQRAAALKTAGVVFVFAVWFTLILTLPGDWGVWAMAIPILAFCAGIGVWAIYNLFKLAEEEDT